MRKFLTQSVFALPVLLSLGVSVVRPVQAKPPQTLKALEALRAAGGGSAWTKVGGLEYKGEETSSGLSGPTRFATDRASHFYAETTDFGIYVSGDGRDSRGAWVQNISGGIHPRDGAEGRAVSTSSAWLNSMAYYGPEDGTQWREIAPQAEAGRLYDRLEATPPGGRLITLWLDPQTRLIDRAQMQLSTLLLTIRYADYRQVAGVSLPFEITSDVGDLDDLDKVKVSLWNVTPVLDTALLARPAAPTDSRIIGGASSTTVPIRLEAGDLLIDVSINGKEPLPFTLDTGALALMTQDAAKTLGLTGHGGGVIYGTGAGSTSTQFARVEKMTIGNAEIDNIPFIVSPQSYSSTERGRKTPTAGLIGLEVFERFAVRLDYSRMEATLTPLASFADAHGGTAVPILFDDDIPLVNGSVDAYPGVLAIDTGNDGYLVVQGRFAERTGLKRVFQHGLPLITSGMGGHSVSYAARLKSIALGPVVVHNPIARVTYDTAGALSSRSEAANIGEGVLSLFNVTFDYRRQVMTLEPIPNAQATPFPRAGLQMRKVTADEFQVRTILPGGPADAAHLKVGDDIVGIDGVPASELSGADAFVKFCQKPGTVVKFAVKHGGTLSDVTLTLREMLP